MQKSIIAFHKSASHTLMGLLALTPMKKDTAVFLSAILPFAITANVTYAVIAFAPVPVPVGVRLFGLAAAYGVSLSLVEEIGSVEAIEALEESYDACQSEMAAAEA